jgi:hypothetical protein
MSGISNVRQTKSPPEIKEAYEAFKKAVEGMKVEKSVKDKIKISRSAETLSESKESDKTKKSSKTKKRL